MSKTFDCPICNRICKTKKQLCGHLMFGHNNPMKNPATAAKSHETQRIMRENGELVPWSKGQTKETHPAVAKRSSKLVGRNKYNDAGYARASVKNSGDNNPAKRPEVRQKIKENHPSKHSQEWRDMNKIQNKGKVRLDMMGDNNPAKRPEVRKKLRDNNAMKRKEVVIKQLASCHGNPNYPERVVFNICCQLFGSDYALNTVGQIARIYGKKPDIVNVNGQKKLIEVFGEKWHKPEEVPTRTALFAKAGWDCLIIWAKELKNVEQLKARMIEFHTRGRFNDCNQNIPKGMVGQSELAGDCKSLPETCRPMEKTHE